MERLIKNLSGQLKKVIKEHPSDVNIDTYWKGVRIGLETSLNVALDLKRVSENSSNESAALHLHVVSQRSELLLAYEKWKETSDVAYGSHKHNIEEFLKANNCG